MKNTIVKSFMIVFASMSMGQSAVASDQNIFGEAIASNQLLLLKNEFTKFRSAIPAGEGAVIQEACVMVVYDEWHADYMNILETTELTPSAITGVKDYEELAADLEKGLDVIDGTYPHLLDNVDIYVSGLRSSGKWPAGPSKVLLEDADRIGLVANLKKCFDKKIKEELSDAILVPDRDSFNEISRRVYTAKFVKVAGAVKGITLEITIEEGSDSGVQPSGLVSLSEEM